MNVPFLKMHGAANDFVVVDHRQPFLPRGLPRWCSGCATGDAAWAPMASC